LRVFSLKREIDRLSLGGLNCFWCLLSLELRVKMVAASFCKPNGEIKHGSE
jgi:hypothetical protein